MQKDIYRRRRSAIRKCELPLILGKEDLFVLERQRSKYGIINNKAQSAETTMKCHRVEESNKAR